jgi:hypothetical protein
MSCYLIGCDLSSPGHDYIALIEAIEGLGEKCLHCLNSAWLVVSDKSAAEIRDELKPYIDRNDHLLVCELSGEAAWRGASKDFSAGLRLVLDARAL